MCDCSVCTRYAEFKNVIASLKANSLSDELVFLKMIYDDMVAAEDKADYYKSIIHGTWPDSDNIIDTYRNGDK